MSATPNFFRKVVDPLAHLITYGPPSPCHAVYSLSAALEYGSGIWLGVDGREVEVTCVDHDLDNIYRIYGWKDKVYVGKVVWRLRQGWPDTTMQPLYAPYLPEQP